MYQLKTTLPDQINNIEDAKKYLSELYNNGESYHPDESAEDILFENDQCVDEQTAEKMNTIMNEICSLSGFDPCEYILSLDPKRIRENIREMIIEANQPLTLSDVKKLKKDDVITVCCKNKDGVFNDYIDTVIISHLTRFKGIKGLVLIEYDGMWSYHCLDKKKFTCPDLTTGEELEVYFIINK